MAEPTHTHTRIERVCVWAVCGSAQGRMCCGCGYPAAAAAAAAVAALCSVSRWVDVALVLVVLAGGVLFVLPHTHTHMSVQGPTSAHSPRADYIYRIFLLFRGWLTGWLADCAGLVWAAALPLPLQQPLCGVDTSALFSCCHGFMINLNLNLKSYIETLTSSSVAVAIGATRTRHPPSPSPLLSSAWS